MDPENINSASQSSIPKYNILNLWYKYEKIAMHFNDLILKIRIQALAAVAAISAIVSILNHNGDKEFSWGVSAAVFFFLILFWVAIWILDFKYYNRLLLGAVNALLKLELLSKKSEFVSEIQLSTLIEEAVGGKKTLEQSDHRLKSFGRKWFYGIVFVSLLIGLLYSLFKVICLS